jgi:hypothetical protein
MTFLILFETVVSSSIDRMSLFIGIAVFALVAFPIVPYAVLIAVNRQVGSNGRPEPLRADTDGTIPGTGSDRTE